MLPASVVLSLHASDISCGMSAMRTLVYLLSVVTLSLLSQSCAMVTQAPLSVQEDPSHFIRIEGRYGDERREGSTRFEHPLTLSVTEWERILSSIQVQSRKDTFLFTVAKNPPEPAFSAEQVTYLARGLQKAFSRAHPDEFVVFGFSETRSPQLTEITTGGWFVEGQRLHLVLANYRHSVSMKHIRDQIWQDPLHSNTSPSYEIVPGPQQAFGRDKGLAGLLSAETPELLINYKALLEVKPILPTAPSSPGSPQTAPAPAPPVEPSLQERLRMLKNFRDQGLITEEEYRDKKKQLLDRF